VPLARLMFSSALISRWLVIMHPSSYRKAMLTNLGRERPGCILGHSRLEALQVYASQTSGSGRNAERARQSQPQAD
jgi:hypothetical protein